MKIPSQKLGVEQVIWKGKLRRLLFPVTDNSIFAPTLQYPGISIPLGKTKENGIPFGIEIDTVAYNDRKLIAIARSIEQAIKHENRMY